jgi:hypothetical protein
MRKPAPAVVSHLFTVRLWFEYLGDGRHEWRGEVREVATGHQHFFREWEGMVGFIKVACAAFAPDAPVSNLERVE